MILGDHPEVSNGPPVTIDWKPSLERRLSVEQHTRLQACRQERTRFEMMMPKLYRKNLLLDAGYSVFEMEEAVKEINTVRAQRMSAMRSFPIFSKRSTKMNVYGRIKNVLVKSKKPNAVIHISRSA